MDDGVSVELTHGGHDAAISSLSARDPCCRAPRCSQDQFQKSYHLPDDVEMVLLRGRNFAPNVVLSIRKWNPKDRDFLLCRMTLAAKTLLLPYNKR